MAFLLLRPTFDLSTSSGAPSTPADTGAAPASGPQTPDSGAQTAGTQTAPATTTAIAPDDSARLPGIDVSHYQGDVDWAKVKAAGISFAYAKASDGLTYVDPKYVRNIEAATKAGIAIGAYHFYEPKDDPVAQAKHFVQTARVGSGSLPPVLDVERTPGKNDPATIAEGAKQWLEYVEQATGCRPVVYASPSYYQTYLGIAFNKYPLWLAEYSSKTRLPRGVTAWQMWQHSQKGRIDGVSGTVDLDYFAGDAAALEAFACR